MRCIHPILMPKIIMHNVNIDSTPQMLTGCLDADYRPIMAIHHKLRQENIHIYDELAADKFFSIRMIGVENSQRGMGVATELIRR